MGLGNLLKSVFGGGGSKQVAPKADPIEYQGYQIFPEPMNEGGQYRTAGRITKEVNGELKESRFIRADNNGDLDSSIEHCTYKAKQIIDEQGDKLFQRELV